MFSNCFCALLRNNMCCQYGSIKHWLDSKGCYHLNSMKAFIKDASQSVGPTCPAVFLRGAGFFSPSVVRYHADALLLGLLAPKLWESMFLVFVDGACCGSKKVKSIVREHDSVTYAALLWVMLLVQVLVWLAILTVQRYEDLGESPSCAELQRYGKAQCV